MSILPLLLGINPLVVRSVDQFANYCDSRVLVQVPFYRYSFFAEAAPSRAPTSSLALLGRSRLCKIAHLNRDLRCPSRKAPAGAGGLEGLGLLIFETKTHSVTAGIMFDRRIGSPTMRIESDCLHPFALAAFRQAG